MPHNRHAQFRTETPFLPEPLAPSVLTAAVAPAHTLAEAEAHHETLTTLRQQLSAAVDTVELAIAANHADYLGGRRCWSYETSNEVKLRLSILKRQRQHLQEAFGACNRRIKTLTHAAHMAHERAMPPAAVRACQFVQVAEKLLDSETLAMLWELVDAHLETA